MASKPSRRRPTAPYATKADIAEIYRIFAQRKEWLERLEHTCDIQFARIAQIQAELDEIRRAWTRIPSRRSRT
jgi:hypothetical protein